ncbi:hypothetical protein LJC45_00570 [Alistipes sp. OttesenSCG-928-B03]|nr:hypothetical protein [Alistipes sp. OttesenSCG-928-B03]
MKKIVLLSLLIAIGINTPELSSARSVAATPDTESVEATDAEALKKPADAPAAVKKQRLTLGGYGEAVMSRMFYSDNYKRYSNASLYKDAPSHGRFDLPHVVFYVGYDFGRGWSLGTEIEFEHGGTESAVEIEAEETGEYESEVERGGEVALEQFWIQKSFSNAFNIRMGHIIVPVGLTNQHHMPTEFFTVYRPEGESTIMPCTWHETGVSLWGRTKNWRYEALFVAGLDADRFGEQTWIKGGAGSPYEFKVATSYAGAFRLDNYSVRGLRMGLSGYIGNSASNSLKSDSYKDIKGTVMIGAFDFHYDDHNFVVRGNFDYGHLNDSEKITEINKNSRKDSPSPKTPIGSDAIAAAVEAGYDLFSQIPCLKAKGDRLYIFGRYDYYDSMYKTQGSVVDNECWGRQLISAGVNYSPMKGLVIKAEFSHRMFKSQYNNENTVSIGIAYSGMFKM